MFYMGCEIWGSTTSETCWKYSIESFLKKNSTSKAIDHQAAWYMVKWEKLPLQVTVDKTVESPTGLRLSK